MSLQYVLTVLILVLAALLFAVALLIYRRKGMSTKAWYTFLGIFIVILLLFGLVGFLRPFDLRSAAGVIFVGVIFVSAAWRWHPPNR